MYDDSTNQVVSGAPTQQPTTQPIQGQAIPMSGGYYNTPQQSTPVQTPQPTPPSAPTKTAPVGPVTPANDAAAGMGLTSNIIAPDNGTTPHFMGNTALIQVAGYPGTYLVDNSTKTIRAFASDQALTNAIPNVDARHIVTVPASYISPGGMLSSDQGYQLLTNEYAIKEDGTFQSLPASNAQLQARYGQSVDQNAEQDAYLLLDGIMGGVRDNPNGGLPASFIDTLKTDKSALAFMISAIAYGGYTPGDVYSEMKRRLLISQGNTDVKNINPISATQTRDKYQLTDAGKQAESNPNLTPPTQIGTLDPSIMSLPLFQIPQQAFNTLLPIMNKDTPEYNTAVSNIQDAYHDVLLQQLSATTDQQKAVADTNWQTFKKNAETQLGLTLSGDALSAWTQIQNARGTFAQQGVSGSGLEAESIDDYLKGLRNQAAQSRTYSQTQTNAQEALYYQKYASAQQVKDLIASDPTKAQSWGLVPSQDIKDAMSFNSLKTKYPNLSDQEINDYISSMLDENGNYRSSLYQTYMTQNLQTKQDEAKYKEGMVQNNSLLDEAKAYREFTTPDVAFLRDVNNPTNVAAGMAAPTINDLGTNIMGTPAQYSSISGVLGSNYSGSSPTTNPTTTPATNTSTTSTPTSSPSSYPGLSSPTTPTQTLSLPSSAPSVMSQAIPAPTPQQFSSGLSMSSPGGAFNIPALQPSSNPSSGYAPQQQVQQPISPLASSKPVPSNMSASLNMGTPSTVGGASASKTMSALSSGMNGLKNFGSTVAGGFKSLFGFS
jgi:hypothetical protein